MTGAPSPDGRYLSFTEWYSANLAVRDLITGECRNLTDEGTWDGPNQWAGRSIWSPDGKQIAYSWYKDGSEDESENSNELRIVGLDDSKPRVLYRNKNKEVMRIQSHAWSRDGKSILAWFGKAGPNASEVVLISVADGSLRVLKSGQHLPIKMDISPDGRYIVYDHSMDFYSPRDIFLLATDGSEEELPLVEHPANDYG